MDIAIAALGLALAFIVIVVVFIIMVHVRFTKLEQTQSQMLAMFKEMKKVIEKLADRGEDVAVIKSQVSDLRLWQSKQEKRNA